MNQESAARLSWGEGEGKVGLSGRGRKIQEKKK